MKLAIMELKSAEKDRGTEIQRVVSLYDMHTISNKRYKDICQECAAPGAPLKCPGCDRRFHTLCLVCPALTDQYLPDKTWRCPCCDLSNEYNDTDHTEDVNEESTERMGLTPDWIISKAAFDVFGLQRPTVSNPSIMKLLDPCTNSKIAPNIPAEKLYDKVDNGLKLTNSWAGYYVILNPDCTMISCIDAFVWPHKFSNSHIFFQLALRFSGDSSIEQSMKWRTGQFPQSFSFVEIQLTLPFIRDSGRIHECISNEWLFCLKITLALP